MKYVIKATNNADHNNGGSTRVIDMTKLPAIYTEIRERVFRDEPIQKSDRENPLIIHTQYYPFHSIGNYGWQLYRTPEGIAMLEYISSGANLQSGIRPIPLQEDIHLSDIEITFHQREKTYDLVQAIVDKHTGLAKNRLKRA